MQRHTSMCREKKVYNLTDIVEYLETNLTGDAAYGDPPVSKVHIAVSRKLLESEGNLESAAARKQNNPTAVANLAELNRIRRDGLWGGRVPVFEAGTASLINTTFYNVSPAISGSIVDFFLSLESDVFVGTPGTFPWLVCCT